MTSNRTSAFVSALLLGCGGPGPPAAGLGVEIDSSGPYPVVRSIGAGPRWTAVHLHTVGATGGPVEFGSVRSVLLDPRGGLYVVDPSLRALTIFDSGGRFVQQLGREGAGPGEYRNPYSIAWLDGHLALLDPGNSRIGVYDSAGRWVSSRIAQRITGDQFIRLYRTPPTFWSYGFRRVGERGEGVFIHHTLDGPHDTVPVVRMPEGLARGRTCQRPDQGISFFPEPFGPVLVSVPAPDGTRAVALTSSYRIAFLNPGGDTARLIERDADPVPITDTEWDEANADWRKFQERWPTAACRGEVSRPAAKPVLAALFYDDRGRLWVELTTTGGRRYDVFDREGRLEATVQGLPSSEGVDPSVAGDRIAMVGRDSADVPVVRVYRISP